MKSFEHPPHLDTKWYDTFEQYGAFQAYEYLNGDLECYKK